ARRHRDDRELRGARKLGNVRVAAQAADGGGGTVDGPDFAGELELREPPNGVAAQVPGLVRGADHRDRARVENRPDVDAGARACRLPRRHGSHERFAFLSTNAATPSRISGMPMPRMCLSAAAAMPCRYVSVSHSRTNCFDLRIAAALPRKMSSRTP